MTAAGRHRIAATFRRLRKEGRGALVPFLMAGDPDPEASLGIARAVLEAGADILELGIPFSDPVADGPVIQRAGGRALAAGTTVAGVLDLVRALRPETGVPLVLMTYWNPVLSFGPSRFLAEAARAGVDGLILVDLPPREDPGFFAEARRMGLDTILLVAPTTPPEREEELARRSRGFLYLVSRAGTTGTRGDLPTQLAGRVDRLRKTARVPIAVGFGISTAAQVAAVLEAAEGAVVGSALVAAIERAPADGKSRAAAQFTALLAAAARGASDGGEAADRSPSKEARP